MNKIFFLIPFLLIGCSTPDIHIPSYSFGDDTNTVNNVAPDMGEEATTEVASIEDNEDINDTQNKEVINTNIIPTTDTKSKKEDIEKEDIEIPVPLTTKKEEEKKIKTEIHKSSSFFSSLFKPKPKVKNEYFTGGQIRSKLVMSDDTGESGLLYKYGYDGEVTSTVHIKHGIKHGLETLFDKKGQVMKRTPYVNGKKDGIVEVYYPDGKVLAQITYVDNKRHGRASKYNHDATINEEVQYDNGRVISQEDDINIPIID